MRKILFLLFVLPLIIGCSSKKPASFQEMKDSVSQAIGSEQARELVLNQLQSALWGEYDVEIAVGKRYTSDSQKRFFRITDGNFVVVKETNDNDSSSSIDVQRKGIVLIENKEEAFKKGIPFFIGEVSFVPPEELHYTVFSNPAIRLNSTTDIVAFLSGKSEPYLCAARLEAFSGSIHTEIIDQNNPLSSSDSPQKRVFKGNVGKNDVLSIVRIDLHKDYRYLASNEISCSSFVKTGK